METDSATGTLALSSMPPSARETQPPGLVATWNKVYRRFIEQIAGDGVTRRQQEVVELVDKRHYLEEQAAVAQREYEERRKNGFYNEKEQMLRIHLAVRKMRAAKKGIVNITDPYADYEEEMNRKLANMNPANAIRSEIVELNNRIRVLEDEVEDIRRSPEELAKHMSWMEWFKNATFDEMCAEIERIEGKKGRQYVAILKDYETQILQESLVLMGEIKVGTGWTTG